MIVLYIILGIIGALGLILLILSLIAPKELAVERSVSLSVPKEQVYESLRFLKNHEAWSPWSKRDPAMESKYTGTDGEVGGTHYWKGNKQVGEGEQEIKRLTPHSRIETELRFLKPWKTTNYAYFDLSDEGPGTRVAWGFKAPAKFPMNVMMMFINMDKAIGKDFEEGLSGLKEEMEKNG